ncbi:hypothetical protein E1B28_007064 [Marasmius oreades]|uniref:Uncharacterized protein n=1 Tax=Marasmius oreades TaxID=181124 RepID=A0A9P7S1G3_9AGAR|nr:uncharacterized protein E1B28_007064 [Marasmius oreades]KAG7093383.1 hypothetical protein E1B28_007064 [Marasmius oreades]
MGWTKLSLVQLSAHYFCQICLRGETVASATALVNSTGATCGAYRFKVYADKINSIGARCIEVGDVRVQLFNMCSSIEVHSMWHEISKSPILAHSAFTPILAAYF